MDLLRRVRTRARREGGAGRVAAGDGGLAARHRRRKVDPASPRSAPRAAARRGAGAARMATVPGAADGEPRRAPPGPEPADAGERGRLPARPAAAPRRHERRPGPGRRGRCGCGAVAACHAAGRARRRRAVAAAGAPRGGLRDPVVLRLAAADQLAGAAHRRGQRPAALCRPGWASLAAGPRARTTGRLATAARARGPGRARHAARTRDAAPQRRLRHRDHVLGGRCAQVPGQCPRGQQPRLCLRGRLPRRRRAARVPAQHAARCHRLPCADQPAPAVRRRAVHGQCPALPAARPPRSRRPDGPAARARHRGRTQACSATRSPSSAASTS